MSRFYAAGSESDSGSSLSDDEQEEQKVTKAPAASRNYQQWSDEEEEVKRVVRSEKDKRFEELRSIIRTLRNHKKIKDFSSILDDFEELTRAFDKSRKVVERDGMPKFFIGCLMSLEDFINECWEDRESRKTMNKNNAKSLTTLRQKLKRYNRLFEDDIAHAKENPSAYTEDIDDEDDESGGEDKFDDDDEDEEAPAPAKKGAAAEKAPAAGSDDDDDDDWAESSSSSSESGDEKYEPGKLTADFFRKKVTADGEPEKKKDKEKKPKKTVKLAAAEEEGGWEEVKGGAPAQQEKPKMFAKDAEINNDVVIKKLNEILAVRGKKGTDRVEQVDLLVELMGIAQLHNLGDSMHCKILFSVIASIFDYNSNVLVCMRAEMWAKCLQYIRELVDLLANNKERIAVGFHIPEEHESFSGEYPHRIRGCALTMVERMDEEFTKILQECDAHSSEYVERLKDEAAVCAILDTLTTYLEERDNKEEICRIYLKKIEHLYYKFDYDLLKLKTPEGPKITGDSAAFTGSTKMMEKLCSYIYLRDNTDRIRTRATLCHIYHHALHGRWFEARDLMLISHLQETIQHSDIPTQILYNRAMVQLGLCAFRKGLVKEAHNCLVDMLSSMRVKELLAQGLLLQRQHERTPEQEKIEKRRQVPYHMHINLELLECVYLVSAMLLEIPYLAAHEMDVRRRPISKNFHHVLRTTERQTLTGPPESMREHIVAASREMKKGDWRACCNFIVNDKMNAKVWDLFQNGADVREMIKRKIQEESLQTYLFVYSSVYDSISLQQLAEMFELDRTTIHSIISKMIINEELMASLDEPTFTVVMHRTEPTRLQAMALQLAEKVNSLVETNERLMEMKQGNFGNFLRGQGGQDRQYQQGEYRDRGNYYGGGGYQKQGNYQRGGNYQQRGGGGYRGQRQHHDGGGRKGGQGQGGQYNKQQSNRYGGREN